METMALSVGLLCQSLRIKEAFYVARNWVFGAHTEGKIKSMVTATRWEIEELGDDGAAGYWVGSGTRHFGF